MTVKGAGKATRDANGNWVPADGSEVDTADLRVVERYRQTHHAVATYFALGYTPSKISQITGKSRRQIHLIWNNPMFQELISQKLKLIEDEGRKAVEEQAALDFQVRILMTRNHLTAEQMMAEKLEAAEISGELPDYRVLNMIAADRADRLGYSKHTIVQHNHDFASQLDRAITRSNRQKALPVIDAEVVEISAPDFSKEPAARPNPTQEPSTLPAPAQEQKETSVAPVSLRAAPGRPSFVEALKRKFA